MLVIFSTLLVTSFASNAQIRLVPSNTNPSTIDPQIISDKIHNQSESIFNNFGGSNLLIIFGQFIDHDITLSKDDNGTIINRITPIMDLSSVYGSNDATTRSLRSFEGGRLKSQIVHGDEMPPFNADLENPVELAMPHIPNSFAVGDVRGNENSVLIALHTLFLREHNRLARELSRKRRYRGNDERIFQEARRINVEQYQKIVYYEWMPLIYGKDFLPKYRGCNPKKMVDAQISVSFSTAAYRFGHSGISNELWRANRTDTEIVQLTSAFFNPTMMLEKNAVDDFLRGSSKLCHQKIDEKIVDNLRGKLFGNMDLAKLNVMRGRLNKMPEYNALRQYFGLENKTLDDFPKLKEVYSTIEEVDVFTAGLSEEPYKDSQLGELFWNLGKEQFQRIRDGDENYFENTMMKGGRKFEMKLVKLIDIMKKNTNIRRGESFKTYECLKN